MSRIPISPTGELPSDANETLDERREEPSPEVPTRIDRFVVLRRVGTGAMGVVYSAYDERLDRRVAIKVLQAHRDEDHETRMIREAQALARVNHPNVVQIYEVGSYEHQVYLAMEFVQGPTIRTWLRRTPVKDRRGEGPRDGFAGTGRGAAKPLVKDWRTVLDVFLQAGRGLQAVHDANLVHRDFKPDNVIVGDDGRVRVLDFGIAWLGELQGLQTEVIVLQSGDNTSAGDRLTRTGQFMGTPAYMSPEQVRGAPVDARSDQFSYCVALHEALYGVRPFKADSIAELVDNVLQGRVREPPPGSRVPGWIRPILLRGLASRAEDRFASLAELLAALERDPGARRRRWFAIGGATALAGTLAGLAMWQRPERCTGASAAIEPTWNDATRGRIEAALHESDGKSRARASDGWTRTEAQLDGYVETWKAGFVDACQAHQRGEQSDAVLDRRMRCLEARRHELEALVGVLAEPGPDALQRAPEAVTRLGSIDACADLEGLARRVAPPTDPAIVEDVETSLRDLDRVEALAWAGRYDEATRALAPVRERVEGIAYPPLRADASRIEATLLRHHGDHGRAAERFADAYYEAQAGGDDEASAELAIELMASYGLQQRLYEAAEPWTHQADALLRRLGDPPAIRANYYAALGGIRELQGRLEDAERALRTSIELLERAGLVDRTAAGHNALGFVAQARRDYAAAEEHFELARAGWEAVLGAEHPQVSEAHNNLGLLYMHWERFEAAEASLTRALEIRRATLDADNPRIAHVMNNLGTVAQAAGDLEAAHAWFEQSLGTLEGALGADAPPLALPLGNLGDVELRRGNPAAALGYFERGLRLDEAAFGRDHAELSWTLTGIGRAHLALGQLDQAEAALRRALDLRLPEGASSPQPTFVLAQVLARRGQTDRALELARRALADADGSLRSEIETWLASPGPITAGDK